MFLKEQILKTQKTSKRCYVKTLICFLNIVFFMYFRKKKNKGKSNIFIFIFLDLLVFENIKQFSKTVNKHTLTLNDKNAIFYFMYLYCFLSKSSKKIMKIQNFKIEFSKCFFLIKSHIYKWGNKYLNLLSY